MFYTLGAGKKTRIDLDVGRVTKLFENRMAMAFWKIREFIPRKES